MRRLNLAYESGLLRKPIIFNTISAYLEKPELSPILNDLLIKSSLPLARVETVFAMIPLVSLPIETPGYWQQYSGGWAWVEGHWSWGTQGEGE
jgi:hypothetical protein